MTIKLLCGRGKFPANAIVTLDAPTEAGLIAAKQATADLTGGVVYVPPAIPNQRYPVQVEVDSTGGSVGIVGGAMAKPLSLGLGSPVLGQQGPLLMLGDSHTQRGTSRAVVVDDGRPWYTVTNLDYTNLGGAQYSWISLIMMDGRAPTSVTFTVDTDGAGRLRLTITGDTAGPWVDVSAGGFFLLSSGTSSYQLYVGVRNATSAATVLPTIPGSGAGSVTASGGLPGELTSYLLSGYGAWLAGVLGDTFSDYLMWGIGGDTSENLLARADQALDAINPAAICLLIGVNDRPSTTTAVSAVAARIIATIEKCLAKNVPVYVGDIFPLSNETATKKRYLTQVSSLVAAYCRTRPLVRFWSAYDQLSDPVADAGTILASAYTTDLLHLMPYGAYRAQVELARMIRHDFGLNKPRRANLDTYDAALGVGAWNTNPYLRGTGGNMPANNRTSGVVPAGWTLSGGLGTGVGTETCVGAFEADPNGGPSWYTMEIANSGASDFHQLYQTNVPFPAEVAIGDKFRIVVEVKIFSASNINNFQARGYTNIPSALIPFKANRNLTNFTTEQPEMTFTSAPMTRIAGMNTVSLSLQFGGDVGGASGKVGCRMYRIERAP